MKKKIRVLWIDGDGLDNLRTLTGPVHAHENYKLSIATDMAKAVKEISENEYDIIICNITILNHGSIDWFNIASKTWRSMILPCLGLQLLYSLLKPEEKKTKFIFPKIPKWISPDKFGILTFENKITVPTLEKDLKNLNIDPKIAYKELKVTDSSEILLDLIEKISEKNSNL